MDESTSADLFRQNSHNRVSPRSTRSTYKSKISKIRYRCPLSLQNNKKIGPTATDQIDINAYHVTAFLTSASPPQSDPGVETSGPTFHPAESASAAKPPTGMTASLIDLPKMESEHLPTSASLSSPSSPSSDPSGSNAFATCALAYVTVPRSTEVHSQPSTAGSAASSFTLTVALEIPANVNKKRFMSDMKQKITAQAINDTSFNFGVSPRGIPAVLVEAFDVPGRTKVQRLCPDSKQPREELPRPAKQIVFFITGLVYRK